MKNKIFTLLAGIMLFATMAIGQTIVKGSGVLYTNGAPTLVATQSADAEIAIDTTTGFWYEYNRDALAWSAAGFRIQLRNPCTTPTHTPGDKQSYVLLDTCDNLYRYRNGTWTQINSGGGGGATDLGYSGTSSPITITSSTGADVTVTQGGIVTVTASGSNMTISATETDGSVTNEGQLGVGAGGANTATITTNTSGGNPVTVSGGGILAVTETTGSNGGTITLTATEVDGSTTNEGTLGVGAGGASSSTIISNTSGASGVTINVAGINSITETTSSNGGSITITATEVDGSTTNELQTIANTSDATSHTATLSNSGGSLKLAEGSGITIATTGTSADGIATITASDPSPTNEIQQLTNSSDATNHYLVLDSGGSITLSEGSGITLTTTGTGDDGIVTIAATGSSVVANNGVSDNEDSGKIRLGNRYMNSPDAPFTMDRKLNLSANKFYIGDNTDSTLLQIDGTNDRVGIGTTTPGRKLTVNGEVEIKDLTTTAATVIVGADGNGVLSEISVGSGLDLTAGVLTATGGGGGGSTDLSYTGTNSPITLNSSTGTDVTITEGGIVDITATGTNMTITAAEVDGSVSNEGQLGVGSGAANTATITTNTSGGNPVTVEAAGILAVTETTGANGGTIVLTATEVDGSVSNEGTLGVGAGGASSSTITTTTSGGNPVTINVAGINAITESTSANGGSITITATEVDGSISNEGSLTVGAGTGSTSIINSNTSGSTGVTITAAGINTISEAGNVITLTATEVDGSISNEGVLGVGAGGANTATITTTTSTGNAVTISGGGILAVTETTSANGGTITLTATEVDGSTTNELQTITNTSNATSHTVTLSNTGGSVQLVEGSNITLTTTGTGADGVVTIASTSAADGNGIYSGSGTIPGLTTATVTNQFTISRATDDVGGLVPVRISVPLGNEPDFMSFVNGSDSLLISKGDQEFEIFANKTLALSSNELVTIVADSMQVQTVPNAVENERTLLLVSPANTIVKSEGLDPDIINQNGATTGQVLEWNGTKWAPAADDGGGSVTANNGVSDNENSGNIRLGNRYMNTPDAPFTMDRKVNVDGNRLYIGDNTDSTLLHIDGVNDRVGIGTTAPGRKLTVNGEMEIKDLTTTSATVIVGADGNGVLSEIAVGSGLSLSSGTLSSTGGTGDINQGGNTFGIDINIGSNDNFAVSLEQNNTRFLTGGTDKNVTLLNSVAATAATTDRLKINTNSTGTAANGFGGAILFNAESSTTDDQELARITGYWTTATHAAREGAIGFKLGNSGGALTEVLKLDRVNDPDGALTLGTTNPCFFYDNAIVPQQDWVVSSSANRIRLQTSTGNIVFQREPATTNAPIDFKFSAQSTGTVANGFGANLQMLGESSTTIDRDMGGLQTVWTTVTDATRTSDMILNTVNSATLGEAFRIYGNKRAMVGGGTNQASAAFHVNSTTGGFLKPKVTTTEMNAISSPTEGLDVYNTTEKGDYKYDGTNWRLSSHEAITGRSTGQTAAVASVATLTVGSTDASYTISGNINVTTSSAESFSISVDYTDETNTARNAVIPILRAANGAWLTQTQFGLGAIPYPGGSIQIRAKASTAITIKTSGTFTGCTYNVEGSITRI